MNRKYNKFNENTNEIIKVLINKMNLAGKTPLKSMVAINQLTEQAMETKIISTFQISKQTKLISLNVQ